VNGSLSFITLKKFHFQLPYALASVKRSDQKGEIMKRIILLLAAVILSSTAYAGPKEVLEFVTDNSEVQAALMSVNPMPGWGTPIISQPEVTLVASSNSHGNMNGGNGYTKEYLVRYPFSLNMDWDNMSDSVFVFVKEWEYSAIGGLRGELGGASKGIKVTKIIGELNTLLK
jgi:hypothetical protein